MAIPVYRPYLDEEEKEKVKNVLESGWLSSKGEELEKFESSVREFLSVDHGWATDSGTAALHSALEAVGVRGKEVIIPGLTFGATASAVKQAGGIPVPVDVEEETHAIDPENLEDAITSDTGAIIVVHLFGEIGEIERIKEIAESEDLPIIEDAAQAFGTTRQGRKAGTIGDIGIFSFSWNKTVTTGKGGFIATENEDLAKEIDSIVSNGHREEEKFARKGYNFRMDSVRASIGNSQMSKLEEISEKKNALFTRYHEELENCGDIQCMKPEENVEPWVFYIKTDKREKIVEELESSNISSRKFYPPVNQLGCVESDKSLPASQKLSETGLILPSYPGLKLKQASEIAEKIKKVLEKSE